MVSLSVQFIEGDYSMKNFKLIAAAALVATTAACVNTSSDYPQPYYGSATSYPSGYAAGYPSGYAAAYPSNYYARQTPYATTQSSRQYQDRNRDGVADWQQVDRNRDGIPDARQQRSWP